MTKTDKNVRRLFYLIAAGILIAILATSCSSIKKLKTNIKHTQEVKTSEQNSKSKDSSATVITKVIDSTGSTVTVVFDEGEDSATTVEIITYPPSKEDYLQGKIGVKTNRKPKSITVNQAEKKADEKAVASNVKSKEDNTKVTEKKETTAIKQTYKKKLIIHWWWFLLLLIPAATYILYRKYPAPFKKVLSYIKDLLT